MGYAACETLQSLGLLLLCLVILYYTCMILAWQQTIMVLGQGTGPKNTGSWILGGSTISGTNVITHPSCSDDWLTHCSLVDVHKGGMHTPICIHSIHKLSKSHIASDHPVC